MKKIVLLICFFCILFLQGRAQEQYQPIFGEYTTEWIVTNPLRVPIIGWTGCMDTLSITRTEGEYKIVEHKDCMSRYSSIVGKIRSNDTNSKLYAVEFNTSSELLIMDLDLEVGDPFKIIHKNGFGHDIEEYIVVDSVYVQDGKKHIRFDGEAWDGTKIMFIEGIGPNRGFLTYPTGLVVCKYDDSVQVYSFENNRIKDCSYIEDDWWLSLDHPYKENDITIYPNPVSNSVTIRVSENAYLTIYNALGTKVLDKTLSGFETVLDISHLPSNIYYFKFQMSNETVTKKIVKY